MITVRLEDGSSVQAPNLEPDARVEVVDSWIASWDRPPTKRMLARSYALGWCRFLGMLRYFDLVERLHLRMMYGGRKGRRATRRLGQLGRRATT